MQSGLSKQKCSLIVSIAVVILSVSVSGCSLMRHSIAVLRSTDYFIAYENDERILYEPGAQEYAAEIAVFLPSAIQQVEAKQYRPFSEPVRVYICASRESFKKYYGMDVPGGVSAKLFLSPRIFDFGDVIAEKYLAHELSHMHLQQQIGFYKTIHLPMWFKEGVATYASNGGGAHRVSEKEAIAAMRAEKSIYPNKADGLIFKTTPKDFDMKPHMFYRQSMMFIQYLVAIDESAFQKLLFSIENDERFAAAIRTAYDKELDGLWNNFMDTVKNHGLISNSLCENPIHFASQ